MTWEENFTTSVYKRKKYPGQFSVLQNGISQLPNCYNTFQAHIIIILYIITHLVLKVVDEVLLQLNALYHVVVQCFVLYYCNTLSMILLTVAKQYLFLNCNKKEIIKRNKKNPSTQKVRFSAFDKIKYATLYTYLPFTTFCCGHIQTFLCIQCHFSIFISYYICNR